jgi:hypothetical protein
MPSIRELFADPDLQEEGGEEQIDIDKVLDEVTNVLNDRPRPEETAEEEEPEPPAPAEGIQESEEEEEEEPAPPPAASPPSDPLAELPPERRAALLALDQTLMSDESKRAQVFKILSGEPQPVQEAKLPDHIDPESFEAQIWREQQEIKQSLSGISRATRDQNEAFAKQQAATAATQAGNLFSQRYGDKLSQDEILEIAKYAGQTGLAGAFISSPEGKRDPVNAYTQALEATLWGNELFRNKVMGEGPKKPVGEQPEAQDRKRKLKAISTGASPVSGPAPQRAKAEVGSDGRLTEKSRQDLIKELANGMARQSEGVF